jgi:hypothetical protein
MPRAANADAPYSPSRDGSETCNFLLGSAAFARASAVLVAGLLFGELLRADAGRRVTRAEAARGWWKRVQFPPRRECYCPMRRNQEDARRGTGATEEA